MIVFVARFNRMVSAWMVLVSNLIRTCPLKMTSCSFSKCSSRSACSRVTMGSAGRAKALALIRHATAKLKTGAKIFLRLDDADFGFRIEKMHLAHVKDQIDVLVDLDLIGRADLGDKRCPSYRDKEEGHGP